LQQSIAALKKERPNHPEAVTVRDERAAELEDLRQRVIVLKAAIAKPGAKKDDVEKSVRSFQEGVQKVWEKHHDWICTRSVEAGLFVLCITACGLAGTGSTVAVLVSAALAGHKRIGEALKSLKGKLK
jgi:hydroxymethylpyrimidine/phosphomethylpyrimidine kinase